ncbi:MULTISPECIES: hypothetical protein [unclassified Microcoleus]|uniref:hypothetical protein n=1 Tax=unclassified Microcoleus TaxID=2642155 RepID=UPI002FCF2084
MPVITDSRLKELRRDHKFTRSPFLPPRFASAKPHAPPPNIVKFTIKFIEKEEGRRKKEEGRRNTQ